MKNLCLLLSMIFFNLSVDAQSLTSSQTLGLTKKTLDYINTYLLNKGWRYYKKSEPDSVGFYSITWGYFNGSNDADLATCWFTLLAKSHFVYTYQYEFSDQSTYNSFLDTFKKLHLKKTSTEIKSDNLETDYFDKKTVYHMITNSNKQAKAAFTLVISYK